MKIVSVVARYLLGQMFTDFGLNGFLPFIHQPPPTKPLALQFSALRTSRRSSSRCRSLVESFCSPLLRAACADVVR